MSSRGLIPAGQPPARCGGHQQARNLLMNLDNRATTFRFLGVPDGAEA